MAFQVVGGLLGLAAIVVLYPNAHDDASAVLVPHESIETQGDVHA